MKVAITLLQGDDQKDSESDSPIPPGPHCEDPESRTEEGLRKAQVHQERKEPGSLAAWQTLFKSCHLVWSDLRYFFFSFIEYN